jgi:hypothetical protein
MTAAVKHSHLGGPACAAPAGADDPHPDPR